MTCLADVTVDVPMKAADRKYFRQRALGPRYEFNWHQLARSVPYIASTHDVSQVLDSVYILVLETRLESGLLGAQFERQRRNIASNVH